MRWRMLMQMPTGELLPMTWDFSHIAVVKHLLPPYWPRLGVRPDLIQRAQQFHFRPFNGHHCQVPVTNGRGKLTPEFLDYVPFMQRVMETWLAAATPGREMFAVPEMGPLWLGYNLHGLPNSWEDAQGVAGRNREVLAAGAASRGLRQKNGGRKMGRSEGITSGLPHRVPLLESGRRLLMNTGLSKTPTAPVELPRGCCGPADGVG